MTVDARAAAWAVVQHGPRTGSRAAGSRLRLALIAPVLAGCQPSAGQVPSDFSRSMDFYGASFTASAPTSGTIPASAVESRIYADRAAPEDFVLTRPMGQPVFGILSCVGLQDCTGLVERGVARAVWVVPYWAPMGASDVGGYYLGDAFSDAWWLIDATTGERILSQGP